MPFCPQCGKAGVKGLCDECKPPGLLESFKEKTLTYCYVCKKVHLKGQWTACKSLKEAVVKGVENAVKKNKKDIKLTIKPDLSDVPENPGIDRVVPVDISATQGGTREHYSMEVRVQITSCPLCSKRGTEYLEAIMQLRGVGTMHHHVIDYLRNEIHKLEDKGMFINKEKPHKDGIDFVVTRKKYVRALSEKVVAEFGGTVSYNTQIFSKNKQTSKDILRLNAKITMPKYWKGDVLDVDGVLWIIRSTKGTEFNCLELKTGKKRSFKQKERNFKLVAYKKDALKTQISRLQPHIEVLHPETFESTRIENEAFLREKLPENKRKLQKSVRVIAYNGLWFVD